MAITVNVGLIEGHPRLIKALVDSSTSAITAGDFVSIATAGYIKQAAAGELPVGVAHESVASPSADGDAEILIDISTDTVYRRSPDAGTVTQALVWATMDVGGARTIDIDASNDDCILCVGVNTTDNTLDVSLVGTAAARFAGVV